MLIRIFASTGTIVQLLVMHPMPLMAHYIIMIAISMERTGVSNNGNHWLSITVADVEPLKPIVTIIPIFIVTNVLIVTLQQE